VGSKSILIQALASISYLQQMGFWFVFAQHPPLFFAFLAINHPENWWRNALLLGFRFGWVKGG